MAAAKKPKAEVRVSVNVRTPQAEPEVPVTDHNGWSHDWRNPEARFAADDHCPNAELRRLAPQ